MSSRQIEGMSGRFSESWTTDSAPPPCSRAHLRSARLNMLKKMSMGSVAYALHRERIEKKHQPAAGSSSSCLTTRRVQS